MSKRVVWKVETEFSLEYEDDFDETDAQNLVSDGLRAQFRDMDGEPRVESCKAQVWDYPEGMPV